MESQDWSSLIKDATTNVRRLSSVWRFSSIPVVADENVAEHTFYVCLYAVMIHQHVKYIHASSPFPDKSGPKTADDLVIGAILLKALVHDLPECVTGDVVRTFKYSSKELKSEVDKAEGKLAASLLPWSIRSILELAEIQTDSYKEYVNIVVKAADFLSLFQYMRREAARGNLEIIPFFNRMITDLNHMAKDNEGKTLFGFEVESFYYSLWQSALNVRKDCFHGLEEDDKWTWRV